MPDPSLSDALKEAYASAPSDVVILHTLEFRHINFTAPIRVVLDNQALTARLEASAPLDALAYVSFVAFAFSFKLPDVQNAADPEIIISIDNVTIDIEDALRLAVASPYKIEVTYRPFLTTDLTAPQMDPPLTLTVNNVEADDFRVTARASFGNSANKSFPSEVYSAARFPGLAR
jgi:hypothetical protein